mmetsp:Transcript_48539/g.128657  ORF Transcript_48539/g.128657 Transcript_48539/m.128657 type:complete len:203 (+) Transcript_48539:220-828(+)
MQFSPRERFVRTSFAFKVSAKAMAPSLPIMLRAKSRRATVSLAFRALANTLTPSSPNLLPAKSSTSNMLNRGRTSTKSCIWLDVHPEEGNDRQGAELTAAKKLSYRVVACLMSAFKANFLCLCRSSATLSGLSGTMRHFLPCALRSSHHMDSSKTFPPLSSFRWPRSHRKLPSLMAALMVPSTKHQPLSANLVPLNPSGICG